MTDRIIFIVVGVLTLAALALLGMALYAAIFSETIVLIEEDWTCTATAERMQPLPVGKIIVQSPQTVCVNYARK